MESSESSPDREPFGRLPRQPFGPRGMELRATPPTARRVSRRGGFVVLVMLVMLIGVIFYGVSSRQSAAARGDVQGRLLEGRVRGASEAGASVLRSSGGGSAGGSTATLEPPPLTFLPRGEGSTPAVQANVASVPPALGARPSQPRRVAGGPGPAYPQPPTGWVAPAAWNEGAQADDDHQRLDRERQAREGGTGVNWGGGGGAGVGPPTAGAMPALADALGGGGGPRTMAPTNNVATSATAGRFGDGQRVQLDRDSFLRSARQGGATENYLQSTRVPALSPYEIKAGWNIPAALEQEINSDLPGEIRALVKENVYDTGTGQYLLIPQGSRLVGTYDSQIAYAQEALLVVWNRIIFPDTSSINLEGMNSQDFSGQSGLRGRVDNHWGRLIGTAALSTAFNVGAVVAQGHRQSALTYPSAGELSAEAAAAEVSRLGADLTRRNMSVQPTIRIPTGTRFNVRVHRDMLFEAPYRPYAQAGASPPGRP